MSATSQPVKSIHVGPKDVLDALKSLPPYPDAAAAFNRLERERILIGTLTNSGEKQTRQLLEAAGLEEQVAEIVSVDEIELYKIEPHSDPPFVQVMTIEAGKKVPFSFHWGGRDGYRAGATSAM